MINKLKVSKFNYIIGADETGVGDYLTPLVVAAVFIPPQSYEYFKQLGVRDSKTLSDEKIMEIFIQIKPKIKSSVRIMSQIKYNYLNQTFNAHELKTLLHLDAINSLSDRLEHLDLILIDQYASEKNMNLYLQRIIKYDPSYRKFSAPVQYLVHGESKHLTIAAASIVARAHFLNLIKLQNQKWNTKFPLGTNSKVEAFTKNFIKKHGIKALNEIAKLSFKTTKKIME